MFLNSILDTLSKDLATTNPFIEIQTQKPF